MLLSFEMANVGDLVFDMAGTSLTSRKAQGTSVLLESKEHGKRGNRGFPGIWEVLSSPPDRPKGLPNLKTSGLRALGLGPAGAKTRCNRGTAKRRKRSEAGWAAGSRSALIVSTKQRNSSREDPVEGSSASSRGPDGRNMAKPSNVVPMSRRRYRIAHGNPAGSESTT